MAFDLALFPMHYRRMSDGVERIRIVCSWCGSADVSRDAWASWDVEEQDWVLGAVFDQGFCQACECERGLEERIIAGRRRRLTSIL
jgi:hypothetical protein